jgi:hypothetical protein
MSADLATEIVGTMMGKMGDPSKPVLDVGGPSLRPHTIPGWWQVWSGHICIALLKPEDVVPLIARTTCYVADTETAPHKVTFANGRTVHVDGDGCLQVGHGEYPKEKRS